MDPSELSRRHSFDSSIPIPIPSGEKREAEVEEAQQPVLDPSTKAGKAAMKRELSTLFEAVVGAKKDAEAAAATLLAKPISTKRAMSETRETLTAQLKTDIKGLQQSSRDYKKRLYHQMKQANADPELAMQIRKITYEIEILEKRIKGLEQLESVKPAVGRKVKSSEKLGVASQRKALKDGGRQVGQDLVKGTRALDAVLNDVTKFSKKFHKELERGFSHHKTLDLDPSTKDVEGRVKSIAATIQGWQDKLNQLESQAALESHLWDTTMRAEYNSHANAVKKKIQELQAETEAFAIVFGDPTRAVLNASDEIHRRLSNMTSKNEAYQLAKAIEQLDVAREAIGQMSHTKQNSISGALALETFRAAKKEVDTAIARNAVSLYVREPMREKLLGPHLTPGQIRDPRFSVPGYRSEIPTVVAVMSQQLARIASYTDLLHHPEMRGMVDASHLYNAIEEFEIMLANLGPTLAGKVLIDEQFKELFTSYDRIHYHGKVVAFRTGVGLLAKMHAELDGMTQETSVYRLHEAMGFKGMADQLAGRLGNVKLNTQLEAAQQRLSPLTDLFRTSKFSPKEQQMYDRFKAGQLTGPALTAGERQLVRQVLAKELMRVFFEQKSAADIELLFKNLGSEKENVLADVDKPFQKLLNDYQKDYGAEIAYANFPKEPEQIWPELLKCKAELIACLQGDDLAVMQRALWHTQGGLNVLQAQLFRSSQTLESLEGEQRDDYNQLMALRDEVEQQVNLLKASKEHFKLTPDDLRVIDVGVTDNEPVFRVMQKLVQVLKVSRNRETIKQANARLITLIKNNGGDSGLKFAAMTYEGPDNQEIVRIARERWDQHCIANSLQSLDQALQRLTPEAARVELLPFRKQLLQSTNELTPYLSLPDVANDLFHIMRAHDQIIQETVDKAVGDIRREWLGEGGTPTQIYKRAKFANKQLNALEEDVVRYGDGREISGVCRKAVHEMREEIRQKVMEAAAKEVNDGMVPLREVLAKKGPDLKGEYDRFVALFKRVNEDVQNVDPSARVLRGSAFEHGERLIQDAFSALEKEQQFAVWFDRALAGEDLGSKAVNVLAHQAKLAETSPEAQARLHQLADEQSDGGAAYLENMATQAEGEQSGLIQDALVNYLQAKSQIVMDVTATMRAATGKLNPQNAVETFTEVMDQAKLAQRSLDSLGDRGGRRDLAKEFDQALAQFTAAANQAHLAPHGKQIPHNKAFQGTRAVAQKVPVPMMITLLTQDLVRIRVGVPGRMNPANTLESKIEHFEARWNKLNEEMQQQALNDPTFNRCYRTYHAERLEAVLDATTSEETPALRSLLQARAHLEELDRAIKWMSGDDSVKVAKATDEQRRLRMRFDHVVDRLVPLNPEGLERLASNPNEVIVSQLSREIAIYLWKGKLDPGERAFRGEMIDKVWKGMTETVQSMFRRDRDFEALYGEYRRVNPAQAEEPPISQSADDVVWGARRRSESESEVGESFVPPPVSKPNLDKLLSGITRENSGETLTDALGAIEKGDEEGRAKIKAVVMNKGLNRYTREELAIGEKVGSKTLHIPRHFTFMKAPSDMPMLRNILLREMALARLGVEGCDKSFNSLWRQMENHHDQFMDDPTFRVAFKLYVQQVGPVPAKAPEPEGPNPPSAGPPRMRSASEESVVLLNTGEWELSDDELSEPDLPLHNTAALPSTDPVSPKDRAFSVVIEEELSPEILGLDFNQSDRDMLQKIGSHRLSPGGLLFRGLPDQPQLTTTLAKLITRVIQLSETGNPAGCNQVIKLFEDNWNQVTDNYKQRLLNGGFWELFRDYSQDYQFAIGILAPNHDRIKDFFDSLTSTIDDQNAGYKLSMAWVHYDNMVKAFGTQDKVAVKMWKTLEQLNKTHLQIKGDERNIYELLANTRGGKAVIGPKITNDTIVGMLTKVMVRERWGGAAMEMNRTFAQLMDALPEERKLGVVSDPRFNRANWCCGVGRIGA